MKFFRLSTCLITTGLLAAGTLHAASTDKAREALSQQSEDSSQEKQLEEVFQAAAKSYSLLKSGDSRLTYSFDYSNFRDSRIDFVGAVANAPVNLPAISYVENSSENTFTNTFSFDYGIWDNVTLSVRIPLVAKYSDIKSLQNRTYRNVEKEAYGLGDVSLSLRYQPFESKPGRPSLTLYSSFGTKTGDSPYELNLAKDLPTGSGTYSLGFGANMSHVLDPVVLFGSVGYNHSFPVTGIDQFRGPQDQPVAQFQDVFILEEVTPGDSYSMSMGFAYSLSYDVSMSASYQMSYSQATAFKFKDGRSVETATSTSGVVNMSLGLRLSPKYIVNVNAGFGLTEDSPDILVGFSLPLDLDGLKAE